LNTGALATPNGRLADSGLVNGLGKGETNTTMERSHADVSFKNKKLFLFSRRRRRRKRITRWVT
jgi:hypothetical protein